MGTISVRAIQTFGHSAFAAHMTAEYVVPKSNRSYTLNPNYLKPFDIWLSEASTMPILAIAS